MTISDPSPEPAALAGETAAEQDRKSDWRQRSLELGLWLVVVAVVVGWASLLIWVLVWVGFRALR